MSKNAYILGLSLLLCSIMISTAADDTDPLSDHCQVTITWADGSQSLMCLERLSASDEDFRDACYQSGMFDKTGKNGPTLQVTAVEACPADNDGSCTVAGNMLRNFHYNTGTNLFNALGSLKQSCIAGRGEWSE